MERQPTPRKRPPNQHLQFHCALRNSSPGHYKVVLPASHETLCLSTIGYDSTHRPHYQRGIPLNRRASHRLPSAHRFTQLPFLASIGDHHSFPPQWSSITFFLIRPPFSSPIFATVGAEIPLRSGDKIRSGGSAPGWKRDAEPEPSLCAPWGPSRLCAISVLKTLFVWPISSFGYA